MIFGPLIMILVLALLIVAVVLLVRWASGPWPGAPAAQHVPPGRTPLDILNDRYARGEIEREEYLQRRKDIGGD